MSNAIDKVDKSYLNWPFLEDGHRELALAIDTWAQVHIDSAPHGSSFHQGDVDAECIKLVRQLGEAGFLNNCTALRSAGEKLDVRSMCLIRETLARYSGLADFAFAMQCLGSVAISLFGTDEQQQAYLPAVSAGKNWRPLP